jgi:hypothetical protein
VNEAHRGASHYLLDSDALMLFQQDQQLLPSEPFMTQWRVLWEREGRRQQRLANMACMVAQGAVSLLIAVLGCGAMNLFGSATAELVSNNVLPSLDQSLLLAVVGSFSVGVAYAYRSRVVRYLAPW